MRPAEIRATLRQRAEECLRLSRELPNIEHKFLALGMANVWILLAEMAERLATGLMLARAHVLNGLASTRGLPLQIT